MKKTTTVLLVIIMLLTMSITVFANNYDVMPCFNNTITTNTNFSIDENGLATVSLRYFGYQNITTGATITCKIQMKVSSSWTDVAGASWTDEVSGSTYITSHPFQLTSKGTYQLVYEYVIRGTGGADDVISNTIEKTYS
ncbi:MAG: hypothetical protein J6B29_02615 [Clostridia bacterium]|nr:hypothetical protein [Clostridia bacterium]